MAWGSIDGQFIELKIRTICLSALKSALKEEDWEVSHCDGTSSPKVDALKAFYAKERAARERGIKRLRPVIYQVSNTPDEALLALSFSTKTQAFLQLVFSSNRSER